MKTKISLLLCATLLLAAAPMKVQAAAPVKPVFFAVLSGGNELDANGVAGAGDPDGRGSATVIVDPAKGFVCFGITVTGIGTPIAAHIHKEIAGKSGSIVVGFTAPPSGNPGAVSGCVTGVPAALINSIIQGPGSFYVNVHTSDFQGGAIRGQLF